MPAATLTLNQRLCLAGVTENFEAGNAERAADAARTLVRQSRPKAIADAKRNRDTCRSMFLEWLKGCEELEDAEARETAARLRRSMLAR